MNKKSFKYSMTVVATLISLPAIPIYADSPRKNMEPTKIENLLITAIDGKTTNIKDYLEKKPLYLKFWASWCQPCREQMPHLQSTYETYGEKVEVVGINVGINDDIKSVEAAKREFKLTVPMAIDNSGDLIQAFNLRGTPYHILIDMDGKVVYKGSEISEGFDEAISAISSGGTNTLKDLNIDELAENVNNIKIENERYTLLFFTSTWCDWYLSKTRPNMSTNCITAQNQINKLSKKYTKLNWIGVISRLWTGESDLTDYVEKYKINYNIFIDESNKYFFKYKVNTLPTLVFLKDGEEAYRTSEFSDLDVVSSSIKKYYNEI